MPRPLWKGSITFGLVSVPISLFSATERTETLSFHLLHKKDGARIDYRRFCEEENVEVPWSEIVKGYEAAKGRYVPVTEEDFAKAKTPATEVFDVRAFVKGEEIDFLYFDTPYYVAPAGKTGTKGYALLRDALEEADRVGVGTIVMREREHVAALQPGGDALVLTTMRFAHEIRSPRGLALPKRGQGYQAKEMRLAEQLIGTLSDTWNPRAFKDTYTDVLKAVIAQKARGKAIRVAKVETPPKVVSLAKALEASLEAGRRSRRETPSRRAAAARRGRRGGRERKAA